MWVVVKSGDNGVLNEDSQAWGFTNYDMAYAQMESDIEREARERQLSDSEDWGANYDDGHGYVGGFNGPEYQIFQV